MSIYIYMIVYFYISISDNLFGCSRCGTCLLVRQKIQPTTKIDQHRFSLANVGVEHEESLHRNHGW